MREKLMQVAKTAGKLFSARSLSRIDQKEGHANFVTNIDKEVEEYLQQALLSLVPGSQVIGEEKENGALSDAPTWIVDPVDGTTNLIHDYRCSAVSIALCENHSPVAGLIWQPYTEEMFYAEAGRGASLNGKKIHVSKTPFEKALVAFGTAPYHTELAEKSMDLALAYLYSCADVRRASHSIYERNAGMSSSRFFIFGCPGFSGSPAPTLRGRSSASVPSAAPGRPPAFRCSCSPRRIPILFPAS